MPKQTLTDIVRELDREAVSLREKLASSTEKIKQLQLDYRSLFEANAQMHREVGVLQTEVAHLKDKTEELDRRRWTLVVALISAAIGGAFAFLAQFTSRALIK